MPTKDKKRQGGPVEHHTGDTAQASDAQAVLLNTTPTTSTKNQPTEPTNTSNPSVVIHIHTPIDSQHAIRSNDMTNVLLRTSPNVEPMTTNTMTNKNTISPTSQTQDTLAVEEIEAKHLQAVLASLTNDQIDHAIEKISSARYSQDEIEAEAQLVSTKESDLPICHLSGDNRPYIEVTVNGVKRHPLLDSGAMVTLISYVDESELKEYGARVEKTHVRVSTVNAAKHEASGFMWLTYEVAGKSARIPTVVMKSHKSYFIVGINFWQAFGINVSWNALTTTQPWSHSETKDFVAAPTMATVECIRSFSSDSNLHRTTSIFPEPSRQPNGILSEHSRVSPQRLAQINSSLPKYASHATHSRIMNLTRKRPATSYNAKLTVEVNSTEQTARAESSSIAHAMPEITVSGNPSKEYKCSAVTLVRQLLRSMPVSRAEVQAIEFEPEIRTATGAHDSYEDVKREKHTCVSEPHELTAEQREQLERVQSEFPYTPETGPLNCTPLYEQRICTGNAPPEMRKQYPMSPYILTEVHKELQALVERDIIEPIDYSPWRWPILYVKKKDGGGRICLDARGLNKVTIRDAYPTLKVDTILQNLPKAKYISCLDMTQAFHQIAIAKQDREKTAFSVGHHFYQFKRATMGFTNSPADLAKVLDKVFGDLIPRVYHYVDDFIVLSGTFEEHIELLREVAKRLRDAQLTISRKKSLFAHKKITFLGYVLTEEGLTPNPERLRPIMEYKKPRTVKELQRLIGLLGWYRRFIMNAAGILAPLTDMTVGDKKRSLEWTEEADEAFEQVKQALMSSPILSSPDYSLPFKVYTDASLVAGAAVLTQMQDGEERVIAYHSVKFSTTQRNYSATERECLAVLSGVEKFRPFIDGVPFTVVTDHASLKWLQNLKEPHGKLARWAVRLQAFDITFEHRPGKQMIVPDALSRSVELIELTNITKTTDDWYNQMYRFAETKKARNYKVAEGLLYHMGRFDTRTGERRWVLCVPKERIADVLKEQHDEAHFGYWKTLRATQRLYYWPNMHRTIYEHVRNCNTCHQIKPSNESTRVPIGQYLEPKRPGRIISLDLVGPLPASRTHKHRWIIVAIDVYSRYVFAKGCTRATSNVITEFLEKEIFYKYDTPEMLISDNGKQFVSDLFKTFLAEHKIRHFLVPFYHPQSNPVEATNKNIKTQLRAELLRRAEHIDWSGILPRAVMQLNTTPRMPTGQSPHLLMFGREKSSSGNEHRVITDQNDTTESNEREEALGIIYDRVAEEQRAAFERNKRQYNLRASVRKFNAGDLVYVKQNKQSNAADRYAQKLAPLKRPVYIRSKESNASDIYIVEDAHGKEVGRFHANQIFSK